MSSRQRHLFSLAMGYRRLRVLTRIQGIYIVNAMHFSVTAQHLNATAPVTSPIPCIVPTVSLAGDLWPWAAQSSHRDSVAYRAQMG